MSFDIVVRDKIAASIETKLAAIERRAKSTSLAVGRMQQALNRVGTRTGLTTTSNSFSNLATKIAKTNKEITTLNQGFTRAANSARRLLSGALLLQGAEGFVDSLDGYQSLQNRLLDVSKVTDADGLEKVAESQARLNELTRSMFSIANRARVPVESLAKTYRRLDNALLDTGASQQESLRITETAGKLLSLSGANAGEAASSLLQLSQAFNKGKLDGDEFRTTAELMPALIRQLRIELEATLGDKFSNIFDASKDGLITVDLLRTAFMKMANQVDKDFERLPRTIGQAFQQLKNSITQEFGQSPTGRSFIDAIISGIDWLRNNMPTVVRLFKAFIVVLSAQAVTSFVSKLFTIEGAINGILQVIPAALAYFTFFADQIKVSSDGVVTLQDVTIALFQVIRDFTAEQTGFLGKIFSVEGAQTAFDSIKSFVFTVIDGLLQAGSSINALYETFKSLSWEEVALVVAESWAALGGYLRNIVIDFFQFMLTEGGKAIDKLRNYIIDTLRQAIFLVSLAATSLPQSISDPIVTAGNAINKMLGDARNSKIDLGITEQLNEARYNIEEFTPTIQKASDIWSESYKALYAGATKDAAVFYDAVMGIARQNADARIALEKKVAAESAINPKALRDPTNTSVVEKSENKYSKIDEFLQSLIKKENLVQAKQALDSVNQTIAKTNQQPDSFAERIPNIAQFNTDLVTTTTQLGGVNAALVTVNGNIAGMDFSDASISVTQYAITAVDGLKRIQTQATLTGSTIKSSQVSAWQAATAAVQQYATTALSELARVQQASGGTVGNNQQGQRINAIGASGEALFRGGSFASGGYTGNGGKNEYAGVVHKGEYVMPKDVTDRYRPALEAMHKGQPQSTGGSDSKGITVNIENYGNSTHSVQQISPNEIRIIAKEVVASDAPNAVANSLGNSNSSISKSMRANFGTARRR